METELTKAMTMEEMIEFDKQLGIQQTRRSEVFNAGQPRTIDEIASFVDHNHHDLFPTLDEILKNMFQLGIADANRDLDGPNTEIGENLLQTIIDTAGATHTHACAIGCELDNVRTWIERNDAITADEDFIVDYELALQIAAYVGSCASIISCLEHGANDLQTALRAAVYNGRVMAADVLVSYGAIETQEILTSAINGGILSNDPVNEFEIGEWLVASAATNRADLDWVAAQNLAHDRYDVIIEEWAKTIIESRQLPVPIRS